MKVVTQNIKIELENDEKLALSTAKCILQRFMGIMQDHDCWNIYFKEFGEQYDIMNLEDVIALLDSFSEDNPTIE